MCQLFESILVNNGVVNSLEYHQRRIERSIPNACINLDTYISTLEFPPLGCFKLRITYSAKGIITHAITPYITTYPQTFRLVTAETLDYHLKYNNRTSIHNLLEQRNGCDDIIITQKGMITDSSIANLALFDGEQWVTPTTPLLDGTCRTRLIENGVLTQQYITTESLFNYQRIVSINAMIGFAPEKSIEIATSIFK